MKWTKSWRLVCAAALAAGCTGSIGSSNETGSPGAGGSGTPTGTPSSGKAGSSGVISGAAGSGPAGSPGVILTGAGGAATPGATPCTAGIAVTSQIARLTNEQYDSTVYDLLGVTGITAQGGVAASTILATDQLGSLTDTGWSAYQTVADLIATQVIGDATAKKKFLATCTPTGDGKSCFHDTIVKFGRKIFRRPLTTDEVAGFDALVAKGAMITPTGSLDDIAQVLLYSFLVSPTFLMRAEVNTTPGPQDGLFALNNYEIASRLSYLIIGSAPDDTLNTAADNNQLSTPAQILTQAQRLIGTTRAHDKVSAFHRYYMLMGNNTRWDNANHDTTIFTKWTKDMVSTLQAETEMFFDQVVFTKNGTFQDLITSPLGYVTTATAPLYGLGTSGLSASSLKEVTLDKTQRPGFLTRLGFLGAYSSFNRSNPILRGAFITKQILGTAIGSPPPGADMTVLPSTADLDTNRKQVDAQTTGDPCMGCHHTYINPPGFILENFDAVGSWQTTERTTGAPIDTVVDMAFNEDIKHLNNVSEMAAAIAASPMAQSRYADRWTSYAYERESNALDSCTVADLASKIAAGNYTVKTLITDLTQTVQFRTRAVGATQ